MATRISLEDARRFTDTVVDVREFPEYAYGTICGARLAPLSTIGQKAAHWDKSVPVLLVCKNSRRSVRAAEALERLGFRHVHILEGGLDAWEAAGLPVRFPEEASERRPPALERQVRMAAGSMVLLFTALGLAVSAWFLGGSLFVGTGLALSGITDSCLMATLLCKLPWNQPRR